VSTEAQRSKILSVPLKGHRDYLRGADLYQEVADVLYAEGGDEVARFSLVFHRLIRSECRMIWGLLRSGETSATAASEFWMRGSESTIWGSITESGMPISQRVPFDEDALAAGFRVTGQEIHCGVPRDARPIDICVAATKSLHNSVLPIERGKWALTRLDMLRFFDRRDVAGLSISLQRRLGYKLTRCAILSSGQKVGDIYFSVITS
jgi:hypothetical protein